LEDIKIVDHKSVVDVLEEATELQTPSIKNAYTKGYRAAQIKYAVPYNCSVCGKVIKIRTKDEKKAVAQYMKDNGWGHTECLKE